ncbi:MAG TPA: HEAT repeat domain-containing protein, partial [Elusimicrobiales bacterium]|nr:HEAT repeat domain-containing protein [Elusimicrobiales bacterium]
SRLRSADPAARMAAAREAGELRSTATVAGLVPLLKDRSQGVAVAAAVSLGQIRDERAVEPLILAAEKSTHTAVRVMIAQSLGNFPGEKALGALAKLADDRSPAVRSAASRSLGKYGPEESADKLIEKTSSDSDPEVRRVAAEALAGMAEIRDLGPRRAAAERALEGAARDPREKNRKAAAAALKRMKRGK